MADMTQRGANLQDPLTDYVVPDEIIKYRARPHRPAAVPAAAHQPVEVREAPAHHRRVRMSPHGRPKGEFPLGGMARSAKGAA